MFNSFGYTWRAMGASWDILRKDKEILVFPILSGILCVAVTASFFVPMYTMEEKLESGLGPAAESFGEATLFLLLFGFYFINYFVIAFFNAAVIGCAVIRMRGGDPIVKDGFRVALSRLPQLLGWAALSATIGMILRSLERQRGIGQMVVGMLGMSWSLISYLAVPVLVMQRKGPIDAARESANLLRGTWGSQLLGKASFGLIGFIIFILMAAGAAVVAVMLGVESLWVVGPVMIVSTLLLFIIISALGTIYQAVLYLYATEGISPEGFDEESLSSALAS